jgi:hypothetical protein
MTVRRQQSLFAAEDWKAAYKAFSQVDFQAYDFDTMRGAMVNYIRTNFPENFNDYIESSEFIAIIELLAFLSQSLAFRMDVNTRENFLETAERRDSVFKLARMLGYNPKRNFPATGLMKIVAVSTNEPLRDSRGTSLQGRTINWDDVNNNMSYEQFLTVLNAMMSRTNRFTSPIKEGIVGNIPTELYQINTTVQAPIAYNLNISVNGTNRVFNVVNPDFDDNGAFFERHPDPVNLFHLIYRNDGRGLDSADTGFFTMFRQGQMNYTDFNYTTPVASREEIVSTLNINENDVYLQEIDSSGLVRNKWTRVPNLVGQTLNYNSISQNTRNLYSIENLGTEGIKLRFPDGNFGNVPIGLYRFWYRVSDPVRYTMAPSDAQNKVINMPYVGQDGKTYTATITMSLQTTVRNSLPAESLDAIKDRAPRVYYTQNRMVSAQDYNVFPESLNSNITKLKAINKTHAGHSRYIDINDPTGTYNNVDTYAKDAFIYVEDKTTTEQVTINSSNTPIEIITVTMQERLKELPINNFVYYGLRNDLTDPALNGNLNNFKFELSDRILWNAQPARRSSKTGYLTEQVTSVQKSVLINNPSNTVVDDLPVTRKFRQLKENCFLKFVNPDDVTDYKWTRVVNVENNGLLSSSVDTAIGPWKLSEEINSGWVLVETIVSLRRLFSNTEAADIERQMIERKSFGLGYDILNDSWYIIPREELNTEDSFSVDYSGRGPRSWLVLMELVPGSLQNTEYKYNITLRGQNYVIQSETDLRFYNIKDVKVVDRTTRSSKDTIEFSTVNSKPQEVETFSWTGSKWLNENINVDYAPDGSRFNLPLKTRSTTWRDVEITWVSNFGIFDTSGATIVDRVATNQYVLDTIVTLPTGPNDATIPESLNENVIIAGASGTLTSIPNNFEINFTEETFGTSIVDEVTEITPFILYRGKPAAGENSNSQATVVFKAELGNVAYSLGENGDTPDYGTLGKITFTEWDTFTKEGTLLYADLHDNAFHSSRDKTGIFSRDKINVFYVTNREQLDKPIVWEIVDVFKEPDGYVDPRKAIVQPIDSDGDLVPDNPRQIEEFVGAKDIVLFETYTDFDGYSYDRPVEGVILDYRVEDTVRFDLSTERVSPGSYEDFVDVNTVKWILFKNLAVAQQLENITLMSGIVAYIADENQAYVYTPFSTDVGVVQLVASDNYFVKRGRGAAQDSSDTRQSGIVRWRHRAPNDVRIDPSISNVVEMLVLTDTYYDEVQKWQARYIGDFPKPPTGNELAVEFAELNEYKSASDSLVFRSAQFKLLFGSQADDNFQAKFRVVKLSDEMSDNELKTRIIEAINTYFDVDNWDFGETFYFTELATYIHQQLGSALGSIVILPKTTTGTFGQMFQVKAEPNELFISTASVKDIEVVSRLDNQTLRVDR